MFEDWQNNGPLLCAGILLAACAYGFALALCEDRVLRRRNREIQKLVSYGWITHAEAAVHYAAPERLIVQKRVRPTPEG